MEKKIGYMEAHFDHENKKNGTDEKLDNQKYMLWGNCKEKNYRKI